MGRVDRPHGLRGDVVVTLTTTEHARVEPGSVLHADGRVLVVRSSSRHGRRWIVRFEQVTDRRAAEEISGSTLRAEPMQTGDSEDLWVHDLVDSEVVDLSGRAHGRIVALVENPASDLLELESGALVPLRFVVGWVEHGRVLRVDPPSGLLEPSEGDRRP